VPTEESAMDKILLAIRDQYQVDFSHYRSTTIGRRIERRIDMNGLTEGIDQYVDMLKQDAAELDQLYHDLLIGVTGFFRDVQPFDSLKQNALMKLLNDHPSGEEFRVWVAACATGEEAYSVAILIDECLRQISKPVEVKVFATDIHKAAINRATAGMYSEDLLQGVSDKRLKRYFSKFDDAYQINPEIRRMVVFAPHNLISNPPFTRLSVVTCRNFLIYLLPKAQQKVINHFHFGLKKGGVLLLGSSESPGELINDFEPVDPSNRLYRKTRDTRLKAPLFTDSVLRQTRALGRQLPLQAARNPVKKDRLALSSDEVLGNLLPPGMVIDPQGRVIQVFSDAGKYLRVRDGVLSSNVLDLVDEDLRIAMGGAIQRSGKNGEPVCYERLQVKTATDEIKQVKLVVTPLPKGGQPSKFVITFEELPQGTGLVAERVYQINVDDVSKGQMENLEHQLIHTREILQATIEEMETSNEELQATNEELIASNEELQSSNEELHSVNEELFTVNGEYQRKIVELNELSHDFDNLLESTEVHTLFLDKDLCIRKFTPEIAEVLHLVSHDVGRKIDAFLHNIECQGLSQKISQVLETGEVWEERIKYGSETEFLMRLLPFRAGDENSGIVLTMVDISKLAAAQAAVAVERERFERAIKANRDGTWDWPDLKDEKMWWSDGCYRLLGFEPGAFAATHSEWLRLIHPADREKIRRTSLPKSDRCYVELHEKFEYRMRHASGVYHWYCHRAVVDHDERGRAVRMTGSIADIQDRKAFENLAHEKIQLRDNFLGKDVESVPELAVIGRQTRQMTRLLDDLLDVARLGHDKIEFRKEIVDVCDVVASVIESVDYQLEEKQQVLKTSICEGPLNVIGDPARISQAQTNLIVNASKFSDPGKEIHYTIRNEGEEAVIRVVDQGSGIAPDLLDHVFELFVQSEDTLDRSAGGMGVGLSLARKIVNAHQGTISANSEGEGHGSTFEIRLPLTKLRHEKREPDPPSVPEKKLACKVLLVEDNVDAGEMLAKTLRRRGFDVLVTLDGKTAIHKFPEYEPDVAVIDIGLPKISGYEVARTIRQNNLWDHILLVALTGYGQKSEKEAVLDAGFDHHIIKPLQFKDLHAIILQHLSGIEAEAEVSKS